MTDRIRRTDSTVRRPLATWSPAVHDLLRYLRAAGFPAPAVVGTDGAEEILSWIDGESGADGWARIVPEDGLRQWAGFLRRYHDVVAAYRPGPDSEWACGAGTCGPGQIICHGDFGPWNTVWRSDEIVGLIDWDLAMPALPVFDVACALEYSAPFRPDEECVRSLRYAKAPDRRRRIEVFCDAYEIEVPDNVAAIVADQQRQTAALCAALGRRGVEPQATWMSQGYLDELEARIAWTKSVAI